MWVDINGGSSIVVRARMGVEARSSGLNDTEEPRAVETKEVDLNIKQPLRIRRGDQPLR